MEPWMYEAVGYLASLLVAISLMMRSVLRLRIINLIGALFFVTYGLLIQAYPVAGMNAFIAGINIYYLVQMLRTNAAFAVVPMPPDAPYIGAFIAFHRADMRQFFAEEEIAPAPTDQVFLILRDAMPVGLIVAAQREPGALFIKVDYVIPGYRDFQPGRFFYTQYAPSLGAGGVRSLSATAENPQHAAYLTRMGFTPEPAAAGATQYRRTLA